MKNIQKDTFVHDSSYIDSNVYLGNRTKIWHFSHVLENSSIETTAH